MRVLSIIVALILLSGCLSNSSNITEVVKVFPFSNPFVSCGDVILETTNRSVRKISRPSDWVVLGSSTAIGAGASSIESSWVGVVSERMVDEGVQVHNIAKGGYTTYHALSSSCVVEFGRPKSDPLHNVDQALNYSPDVVLINFPSNDAVSGFSYIETAFNLMLIRQHLSERNVISIVLMSQPRNTSTVIQQRASDLDNLLKPLLGDCYVDLQPLLKSTSGGLSIQYDAGDGIHLNDEGHKVVGDAVISVIESKKCLEI